MTDHRRPTGPGALSPAAYPTTGLSQYDPRQSSPQAIREWLASALPDGVTPDRDARGGVTLLPLGEIITAVRMTARLVHAAAGTSDPEAVAAYLAETLCGPVIHDASGTGRPYYALTPHRDREWMLPADATHLATGAWLGVPDLDRRGPHGAHWVIPPRYRGDLCRIDHVCEFIIQGLRGLIPAAEGEDQ
ncbi:hypothetical protein [Streptomyces acidiscabies]|uniref:hypothetical protein n=1 Tax=Streptomyces acidiscabies TaxID=42234 RepID=UPI00073E6BDC|nr:hypothetical protein [Streptomyces acidiscabies]GAQ52049.1 hypothetical protein a10_01830 [Streptomyces acidiscabies]